MTLLFSIPHLRVETPLALNLLSANHTLPTWLPQLFRRKLTAFSGPISISARPPLLPSTVLRTIDRSLTLHIFYNFLRTRRDGCCGGRRSTLCKKPERYVGRSDRATEALSVE